MARIPYPDASTPELAPLVADVESARGALLELYHALLHAPPVARGWLEYLSAIRNASTLPADLRELAIIRVAHLNQAPYEAHHHSPIARREGLSDDQIRAIAVWEESPLFDCRARDVLAYTDAMTRSVQVPDQVFAALRTHLDERQIVELTATVAAYNMVSRFLEALEIRPR